MSSLTISPSELVFPAPFTRVIHNILTLSNTSSTCTVAFKVKTTAPKRYCVRPNLGIVEPGEKVEVQVLLNYNKDPPKPGKPTKDRFLVQGLDLKDAVGDLKSLFASTPDEEIKKYKVKCRFSSASSSSAKIQIGTHSQGSLSSPSSSTASLKTSGGGGESGGVVTGGTSSGSTFKKATPMKSAEAPSSKVTPLSERKTTTLVQPLLQKDTALRAHKEDLFQEEHLLDSKIPSTFDSSSSSSHHHNTASKKSTSQRSPQYHPLVGPLDAMQLLRYLIVAILFFILGWMLE